MVWGILILLVAQACGDLIAGGLHLPLPGTVLGIVILAVLLRLRPSLVPELEKTSGVLLKNFALFLIPIGFTAGLSAHAVGVTRALQLGETEAAFASVGMLLNALATSALVAVIMLLG